MIVKENQQKFEELLEQIKGLFPDTVTSVKLVITAEITKMVTTYRYPDELKKKNISIRNIKGEWIK